MKFVWKWWFFKNLVKTWWFLKKITRFSPGFEKSPSLNKLLKTWWFFKTWWKPGEIWKNHQVFTRFLKIVILKNLVFFFPKITRFSPGFWISPSVLKLWWKLGVFLNPPLVCVNFICRTFRKKRFWQLDIFAKRLLGSGTKTASWKRFFGSEPNT